MYKSSLLVVIIVAIVWSVVANRWHENSVDFLQTTGERWMPVSNNEDSLEGSKEALRVSKRNPRYFADAKGREVLLVGSHTWANFVDAGVGDPPPPFDYTQHLEFLTDHGHNFFRLWATEQTRWVIDKQVDNHFFLPHAFVRSGPGVALDGKPRFDLSIFNEEYFQRLKQRVDAAANHGIYVAVMLFNGWSNSSSKGKFSARNVWHGHPFHHANNINGLDGDSNGDDSGEEIHTLSVPEVTEVQAQYVRKVVRTLSDSHNVLYEISNESNVDSVDWQYFMINLIREEEEKLGVKHPVGMTALYPKGTAEPLFDSSADWISPSGNLEAPTPANGTKVIISDTDHLCGICGTRAWAWKSFLSGENPIFMDPYDGVACGVGCHGMTLYDPRWMEVRNALGHIRALSTRLDLGILLPSPEISSTGYCLATTGDHPVQLVTYIETDRTVSLDLGRFDGPLVGEWIDPSTGLTWSRQDLRGGSRETLAPPFTGDAVLYLHD